MPPYENDSDMIGLLGRLTLADDVVKEIQLPLTGVAVEAEVVDFIAEVKLSQCYENTESVPIEATYHFPVDEAAAVCGFQAEYEDGTIIKGVVKEKTKAREEYKDAISQGKQASLLEAAKRDIFSLSVGNVPAGGYVKITITYVTSLKAQDDAAAFILPTYIAPRYSPRDVRISPDEARAVSPPTSSVKLFGLDINIKFSCRSNIKTILSPTHSSETTFASQLLGKTGHVTLSDVSMDKDLVVLVTEEHPHQPRASIEVASDGSIAGFVTLFPQIEFKDLAREFVFLIDRSGSMNSRAYDGKNQIGHASDALLLFLRALPPSCTFNIVGFGTKFKTLFQAPQPYNDETLEEASRYAMNMRADMGGTEIKTPLDHVLRQQCPPGVQRQVFILTDGQVSNDLQVFETIRQHCSASSTDVKCRLFSLGIGTGVSRHLVEGMARAGCGTARFVEGGNASSLRVKVLGQLKQALQPALDQVTIEWIFPGRSKSQTSAKPKEKPSPERTLLGYLSPSVGDPTDSVTRKPRTFPSVNPPVFNKEKYLSFAIFPAGNTDTPESVTVKCSSPDGPMETTIKISDNDVYHGTIAHKLAARSAISEFEDGQLDLWRPSAQSNVETGVISEAEALQLALDNNLVSEKTSFISVLEDPVVRAGTGTVKHVIPQYVPAPNVEESRLNFFGANAFMMSPLMGAGGATYDYDRSKEISFGRGGRSGRGGSSGGMFSMVRRAPRSSRKKCKTVAKEKEICRSMEGYYQRQNQRPNTDSDLRDQEQKQKKRATGIPRTFLSISALLPDQGDLRMDDMETTSMGVQALPSVMDGSQSTNRMKKSRKAKAELRSQRISQSPTRPEASQSLLPPDTVMQLCMLQKANGSFALDDHLAKVIGITSSIMHGMAAKYRGEIANSRPTAAGSTVVLEHVIFATLVAVSAMRSTFAFHKEVWELQEGKAMSFLASSGLAQVDVDRFVHTISVQLRAEANY